MESDSHKHSCPQDTSGPEGPTGVCDSCPVAAETSKLLEELRRARQEAISASIAKSQFLANMSHEIRTPLNAINGLVRLLEDTPVTEEQRRLLSGLGSSSDGLLAIVNDILDFSKIEAGLLELSENEFSPRELVRKALEAFEYKAEEKSITLKLKYDDRIADHLLGDCVRLRQILVNLLNNAIKFTPKGLVVLECRQERSDNDSCTVSFMVSDTGIGIAQEDLSRIFSSFQQVDTGSTRHYGGTGLGLAISRQLVELMGGMLEVRSVPDKGSDFFFTVTFRKVHLPDGVLPAEPEAAPDFAAMAGLRVLLVEDNPFNQFIARSMLEKWKMEVVVACTGRQALDILAREAFSVVLMDLQMPEMGGFEATKLLRSELGLDVPVVALTANAVKGVIEECHAAGMDDYLMKPFNPVKLAQVIGRVTAGGRTSLNPGI